MTHNYLISKCRSLCLFSAKAHAFPRCAASRYKRIHQQASKSKHIVYDWAKKKKNLTNISKLMEIGSNVTDKTKLASAQWLHNEIAIRSAHQVKIIDKLPHLLCLVPSVRKVREWYMETFEKLVEFPYPSTPAIAEKFSELLDEIYSRHDATLITMSKGIFELKQQYITNEQDISDYDDLNDSLDKFFHNRIGMRLLVGHHLEMIKEPKKNFAGLVLCNSSPEKIAREAIDDASYVCTNHLGKAPEVTIHGSTGLTFPYIPAHIYYILFEILKNSMCAVLAKHDNELFFSSRLPPIRLIIADGKDNEDVCIKISDEGGGIKRSQFWKIWQWTYSTTPQEHLYDDSNWYTEFGQGAPLSGFGTGIPLSKLYAQYFGGKLCIVSMEGYGTDAYLHLPRLGNVDEQI